MTYRHTAIDNDQAEAIAAYSLTNECLKLI